MKCVKKNKEMFRVDNNQAENMVNKQGYQYCSKMEWKISKGKKVAPCSDTESVQDTATEATEAPKGKGGGKSKKTIRAKRAKVQKTAAELLK